MINKGVAMGGKNGIILITVICLLGLLSWGVFKIYSNDKEKERNWKILQSFQCDLDKDGAKEKITVFSTVAVDVKGNMLWDDSQWWKVSIFKGNNEIMLFEEYITLGNVYVTIGQENGLKFPTIALIRDDDDYLTIIKYSYSDEKKYQKQELLKVEKQVRSGIPFSYSAIEKE